MKAEILVPEAPETHEKARGALKQAQRLTIEDNQGFVAAGDLRSGLKAIADEIDATFDGPIAAAFRAHKEIVAAKKRYSEPLDEAQRLIKQKMIAWQNEQERLRRLEQARLEAEAKKKAEEEALELAATLEAAGANEAAAQILDEPVDVQPVILPKATPKIQGFTKRKVYSAEVVDPEKFFNGVVVGVIPREAMIPDQQFLNKQAGALKEAMSSWPGVKVSFREV